MPERKGKTEKGVEDKVKDIVNDTHWRKRERNVEEVRESVDGDLAGQGSCHKRGSRAAYRKSRQLLYGL